MNDKEVISLQQRTRNEIGSLWLPQKLALPHLPALLGAVNNKTPFNNPATLTSKFSTAACPAGVRVIASAQDAGFITDQGLYCEDLPIKLPNTEYRIPQIIWDNFGDLLAQEINLERLINRHLGRQYIYLTVQQSMVEKDNTHRPSGVHIDGFQKPIIIPQPVQHQVSVCNIEPTKFYAAALGKDPSDLTKKQLFTALAQHCNGIEAYRPPEYELHLLNAYCPHEPAQASIDGFRSFVRFSASSIPFMGNDNTRNDLFNYQWNKKNKDAFYKSITKPEFL
jgi:hypothetical protein